MKLNIRSTFPLVVCALVSLFSAPVANAKMMGTGGQVPAGYWVCENAYGYRYFSKMMKCEGRQEKDGSCNFNSAGAMAMGCKYEYSLGPEQTQEKPVALSPPAQEPTPPPEIVYSPPPASTPEQPVVDPKPSPPATTQPSPELLKKAKEESVNAKNSAAEFQNTISLAKIQNFELSDQLKTGKMDLGSYLKNNPFRSSLSGAGQELTEKDSRLGAISSEKKNRTLWGSQSSSKTDESNSFSKSDNRENRTLASNGQAQISPSSSLGKNNSGDAWLTYMGQIEKSNLIDQLRRSSALKEQLLAKIQELKNRGDAEFGLISFLEEVYQESLQAEPDLSKIQALSVKEAFSLNDEETRMQILGWMQELEQSDPQFLPQESLFERIQWAHRKFARKEQSTLEKPKLKRK